MLDFDNVVVQLLCILGLNPPCLENSVNSSGIGIPINHGDSTIETQLLLPVLSPDSVVNCRLANGRTHCLVDIYIGKTAP